MKFSLLSNISLYVKEEILLILVGDGSQIKSLKQNNCDVDIHDPWTDKDEIKKEFKIKPVNKLIKNTYDGIILAVAHDKFRDLGIDAIIGLCKKKHVIYDLKQLFNSKKVDLRL